MSRPCPCLADLRDEVTRLLPDRSTCVAMEMWNHRSGNEYVTVQIWDGERTHEGLTVAGALEALRLYLGDVRRSA